MKKLLYIMAFVILLLFSQSACRKIKYEEGDKLPRRKFLETINGVWKVEHFYSSINLNTYSEDSVPYWNIQYGGMGTITIDYYNRLTLNYGSHKAICYFSIDEKEVGYTYFRANFYTNEFENDTAFSIMIQKLPIYSEVWIIKLEKNNLVLMGAHEEHGDRLELVKN
jgi:hypothetical protein